MSRSEIGALSLILLSFLIGVYFCPLMPELMAVHWNLEGQVDGYVSRFWGLFLLPFVSIGSFLFFLMIPKIDPLRENYEKFKKYYAGFVVFLIVFLFYLDLLVVSWNLNVKFNMIQALAPAFGFLYYFLGVVTQHVKRNWFVGIRTPWTLSNAEVWNKTHELGAKLFKACGVVAFFGLVVEQFAMYFMVLPVILVAVYTTVFSYSEHQRQIKVEK